MPNFRIAGDDSGPSAPVPGVDYQSLLTPSAPPVAGGMRIAGDDSLSSPTAANLADIQKAQDDYAAQQAAADKAAADKANGSAPFWAKAAGFVGKMWEASSGSTYTRKLPIIGDLQQAAENLPVVGGAIKTGLEVATNPLTYLTLGAAAPEEAGLGIGLRVGLPALEQGLGAAAGGAVGQKLGELYAKTGLPGGSVAPLIGGLIGGIKGVHGANSIMEGGLGNLPGGAMLPESVQGLGINSAVADAKGIAVQAAREQAAAVDAGQQLKGNTLWTQDNINYTPRKPTPIQDTLQLSRQDIGTPESLLKDPTAHDPEYVVGTLNQDDAYKIASAGSLTGENLFHPDAGSMSVQPGDGAVVRIPAKYAKIDPTTGQLTQIHDLGAESVQIYTNDSRGGGAAWRPISGLVGDEKMAPWQKYVVPNNEEGVKFTWDGAHWVHNQDPAAVAAQQAASAAANYGVDVTTGAKRGSGVVTTPPSVPAADLAATHEPLAAAAAAAAPVPASAAAVNPAAFHNEVVSSSIQNGGGTFDVANGEPIVPKAFAEKGQTGNISTKTSVGVMPKRSVIIPQDKLTPEFVQQWEKANANVLNDGVHHMGTWVKDGEVHFDIVELTTPAKAVNLGLENTEHSVFNMRTGQDIAVPGVDDAAVKAKFAEARIRGQQMLSGGVVPAGQDGMIRLEHYSNQPLSSINPDQAGTSGVGGAELNIGGPKVSHFYPEGTAPEQAVLSRGGTVKHTAEVPASRILDLNSAEGQAVSQRASAAAQAKVETRAAANGGWKVNEGAATTLGDVRQQAKDEGFLGITNSDKTANPYGNHQLFEPVTPTHINGEPVAETTRAPFSTTTVQPDGSAIDEAFKTPEAAPAPAPVAKQRVTRTALGEPAPVFKKMPDEALQKQAAYGVKGAKTELAIRQSAVEQGLISDRPVTTENPTAAAGAQKLLDSITPEDVNPKGRPSSVTLSPADAEAKGLYTERALQNGNSFYSPDGNFVGVDWTSKNAPTSGGRGNYTHVSIAQDLGFDGQEAALQAGYVRIVKTPNAGLAMEAATRDDLAMAASQALRGGENPNTVVSWDTVSRDALGDHGKSALKDLVSTEDINPRGRPATTGIFDYRGEAGNWLPDTIKQLYADGKIVNGTVGATSVQDILGKMAAADFLMHPDTPMDWEAFGKMVQDKYGIDLNAPITPATKNAQAAIRAQGAETLGEYVGPRMQHYVDTARAVPRYNGPLANEAHLIGLLLTSTPEQGAFYKATLPAVYDMFGADQGNLFLKFVAQLAGQRSPTDNIEVALNAFADHLMGYMKDEKYIPEGLSQSEANALRYVANGGEVSGLKLNPFHQNLTLTSFNTAIDRWIFRLLGYDPEVALGSKPLTELAMQQMRTLGDKVGLLPEEVQARLWAVAKNLSEQAAGGEAAVNTPYDTLMLGGGKINDAGKLTPNLEDELGSPAAKQTLQHILDMRDKGLVDLPKDTAADAQKAQQIADDYQKTRMEAAQSSMKSATQFAAERGVSVEPGDTSLQILDKVYAKTGEVAQGPEMLPHQRPTEIHQTTMEARMQRSNELQQWHDAGALNHPDMPSDLQGAKESFTNTVRVMSPQEVQARYFTDARTTDWQKAILQEQRPNDITEAVAQEARARPAGVVAAPAEGAGAVVQPDKMAILKDDLRKAGVPEERVDEIAQNAMGAAQSPEQATEAGQAIRGNVRAEALAPSPYGDEATIRAESANAPKVNGRPVVSLEPMASGHNALGADIQNTIANSTWAPQVDKAFADSVDYAVNVLDRGMYKLQGAGPTSGGLYYKAGEIGFYNETKRVGELGTETVPRAEATIHLNPVEMFAEAQQTARAEGITLPEALANETIETSLHEVAHDIAFHTPATADVPKDQQFLRVLNDMKENAAPDLEAQRQRILTTFQKMNEDGTLVEWKNDNVRIRQTAADATATNGERAAAQGTNVGANPNGNAEGMPLQTAARPGRGEGVPPSAASGGGEPGTSVPAVTSPAEQRLATSAGLPASSPTVRVVRTDLDGTAPSDINPRGKPATVPSDHTPGAPGQPDIVAVKTPAPQLLEKAGTPEQTKVFETPVPDGQRILAPAKTLDETADSIINNNVMRRAATRAAESNPLLKHVLDVSVGKNATAVTQLDKYSAAYAVKTDVDASRLVMAMSEIRQAKSPFDTMAGDLTNAKDWRGNDVVVPLGDLLSHPNNFLLNDAQRGYVGRVHQVLDEAVADAKAQGVDIKSLALTQGEGSHWIPRWVQGADGVDLERPYGRSGFGSKQSFEKTRQFDTQAEGMATQGIQYHNTIDAVQNAVGALMQKTRDTELISQIKQMGLTPSELAGPEVRGPLDAQVTKLVAARAELNASNKAVASAKARDIAIQAGRKTLSPADIRSFTADHPDVQEAVKNQRDAIRVRNALQTRYDALVTPAAKERVGTQLDAAKTKVADTQAAVKDIASNVRSNIVGSDQAQVGSAKEVSTGSLSDAVAAQKTAQAKYDSVYAGTTQAKRDLSAIYKNKATTFRESGTAFGMDANVIPVRQSKLPALTGRIFPSEMADQFESELLPAKNNAILSGLAKVNDFSRMMVTATDFAAPFLQGLPTLARNPVAWARAMSAHFETYLNPQHLEEIYASNRDFAATSGFNDYVGGLNSNEFYNSATGGKTIVGKAAESQVPLVSIPAGALGRFRVAFDAFNDVTKLELWRAMYKSAEGDPQKLEQLGTTIRNMTGTTSMARAGASGAQRQLESLVMFAPRFTRSAFALSAQAMQGGIGGGEARRTLASLIMGGMAMYAGTKMLLHAEGVTPDPFSWKDFDPSQGGRFMSVKVGDNYIGLGGSMRGAIQMLGSAAIAGVTNPSELVSTDTMKNPFLKFARSRSAPGLSDVWNLISGKDPIGHQYANNEEWLRSLPDTLMPFGVSALSTASGSPGARAGIYIAQTAGLRTFPETKNETLGKAMTAAMDNIPTDVPGFSVTDRAGIKQWGDLTKLQKVTMLQRAPELRNQLDPKEAQYWTGYKQVQADAAAAKLNLGQQLLSAQAKQAAGTKLGVNDMTPVAYRKALADIQTKMYAAEAALNGANSITGLGGNYSATGGPTTHRQQVMTDYYNNVSSANFIDPKTGQMDFTKKDELESTYLAGLSQNDRTIISQEQGAEYDIVARELKAARLALAPFWGIGDSVAKSYGYQGAQDLAVNAPAAIDKLYAAAKTRMQTQYRRQNPEADSLLVKWGYVSQPITAQGAAASAARKAATTGAIAKQPRVKRAAL